MSGIKRTVIAMGVALMVIGGPAAKPKHRSRPQRFTTARAGATLLTFRSRAITWRA